MSCHRLASTEALPPGDVVERTEHMRLEPLPRVVRTARKFVDEHAPPISPDTRDVLLLLTSELVTNAVIHARTSMEVGITVTGRAVLVTVHDEDLGHSETGGAQRDGGRGLGLVEQLSESCDMERHTEGGKTAWFRLSRYDEAAAQ